MEFPHLLRLLEEAQFDTIYHEHYSYFSPGGRTRRLRAARARTSWPSRSSPTHGGSLRVFVRHAGRRCGVPTGSVAELERASEMTG